MESATPVSEWIKRMGIRGAGIVCSCVFTVYRRAIGSGDCAAVIRNGVDQFGDQTGIVCPLCVCTFFRVWFEIVRTGNVQFCGIGYGKHVSWDFATVLRRFGKILWLVYHYRAGTGKSATDRYAGGSTLYAKWISAGICQKCLCAGTDLSDYEAQYLGADGTNPAWHFQTGRIWSGFRAGKWVKCGKYDVGCGTQDASGGKNWPYGHPGDEGCRICPHHWL